MCIRDRGRTARRSAAPACSDWSFSARSWMTAGIATRALTERPAAARYRGVARARACWSCAPTRSLRWRWKQRRCSVPLPVLDLRQVLAVAGDVLAMLDQLVAHALAQMRRVSSQSGDAIDHAFDEMKPVELVQHCHVERRRRGAFFLVAAHVQ